MQRNNLTTSIVLLLVGIVIGFILSSKCDPTIPIPTDSDTIIIPGDTTYVVTPPDTIEVSYPVYVQLPPDTVIDTVEVIQDYYTKWYCSDTITSTDSLVRVVVNDTLYRNRIQDRTTFIMNKKPTSIITNTYNNYYNQLWVSGEVLVKDQAHFGIGVDYTSKSHGAGIRLFDDKTISLTYKYTIKSWVNKKKK